MSDLLTALKARKTQGLIPVIPDIKCFSPKEGDLLRGRDPVAIAKELASAGACALSVVTESSAFHGSLELLRRICAAVPVPVLRKDFVETKEDLQATKLAGASSILLMYSCLGKERLETLYRESLELDLVPFVETHTAEELRWAGELGAHLIGINNRDILQLEKDDGDVSLAASLLHTAPDGAFIVVESGLQNGADVRKAVRCGAGAALVGTAILKAPSLTAMFRSMTRPCNLKICGLMDTDGVYLCLQNQVDMLGFVTEYPVDVPWNLSRSKASALISCTQNACSSRGSNAKTCIVTGGSPEKVIRLAEELRPDFVQLHYTETLADTLQIANALHRLQIRIIRSIPSDIELRRLMFGRSELDEILSALQEISVDIFLFDSRDAGNAASGGGSILQAEKKTGLSGRNPGMSPFMFGGGLNADNIRQALNLYSPDWLDIMTGSEISPGRKSETKIRKITAALEQC